MALLNTKTSEVKFSLDNIIKNKTNHPELIFDDYKNINEIISNPDEINLFFIIHHFLPIFIKLS